MGSRRLGSVVAVLVLATLAAPAYGIVRHLGLFGESEPRYPQVFANRPESQRPGIPRALRGPARTILTIPTHDGGRAAISTRPAEDGGLCWYMEQPGGLGVGGGAIRCRFRENQPEETHPFDLLLVSNNVQLIGGEVPPHVAALELRFADGTSTNLSLAKNFFIYEVPERNYAPEGRPVLLVARNATGAEVGRTGFCWKNVPPPPNRASVFCPG